MKQGFFQETFFSTPPIPSSRARNANLQGSRFLRPGLEIPTSRAPGSNLHGSKFQPPGLQVPASTAPSSNLQGSRFQRPGLKILTSRVPHSYFQVAGESLVELAGPRPSPPRAPEDNLQRILRCGRIFSGTRVGSSIITNQPLGSEKKLRGNTSVRTAYYFSPDPTLPNPDLPGNPGG